jgi:hypothetical protein
MTVLALLAAHGVDRRERVPPRKSTEEQRAYQVENSRRSYFKNREKVLARSIIRRRAVRSYYDPEVYNRMVAEQDGKCALCSNPSQDGRALHADHCPYTLRPRRPLCHKCNTGLGFALEHPWLLRHAAATGTPGRVAGLFNHDPELMERAARYIETYWPF